MFFWLRMFRIKANHTFVEKKHFFFNFILFIAEIVALNFLQSVDFIF